MGGGQRMEWSGRGRESGREEQEKGKAETQSQELNKITLDFHNLEKNGSTQRLLRLGKNVRLSESLTITLHFLNSIHSSRHSREKTNYLPPQLPLYLQRAFKSSKQMGSYMKIFNNKKHFHFTSGL